MDLNATLFGQVLFFGVFVWFCMKFVWPPLISAIELRQKEIADGIENSKKADIRLKHAKEKASSEVKEAKIKASDILKNANSKADEIILNAKEEANLQKDKILEQAKVNAKAAKEKAKKELQAKLASLAIIAAEKILKQSVSKNIDKSFLQKLEKEL